MHNRTIRWLTAALILVICAAWASAADPDYFVRKDTWLETIIASRNALWAAEQQAEKAYQADKKAFHRVEVEVRSDGRPVTKTLPVAGLKKIYISKDDYRQAFLTDWKVSDMFGKALAIPASKVREVRLPKGNSPRIEPRGRSVGQLQSVLLRRTEIELELAPEASNLEVTICAMGSQTEPLTIRFDRQSAAKSAQLHEAAVGGIWSATAAAFNDAASIRQREIERHADIWTESWQTGDWAELAGRYARASGKDSAPATALAKKAKSFDDLKKVRDLFYVQYAENRLDLARRTLRFVEQAGAARPVFAAKLKGLEARLDKARKGEDSAAKIYAAAYKLRRMIILSHPLLGFDRLVINKRTAHLPHHMCDQYLGRGSRPGPGLVVLKNWKDKPEATELLTGKMPEGGTIHPDLSYDGRRVLFAFAPREAKNSKLRGYDIYEYSFDTGRVRQVTGTPRDPLIGQHDRQTVFIEDFDPVYLPDGGFAFISTRSQQYGRCHGGRYVPSYTLYRGQLDGSDIRPLSFNEANEWGPAVLHDGSLVYCRWDYINRNDVRFQSLWQMHPDGTQTAHYYGNNSTAPCLISEPQPIPGSHKVVCTAAAHHGQTIGTLVVVDNFQSQEQGQPLTWLTPELRFPESGVPGGITRTPLPPTDQTVERGGAATPWPINENLFLCAYPVDDTGREAIYLIDTLGGRELIYEDPGISCFDPIPLRPRPMPPALPSALPPRDGTDKTGVFVIQDVYQSTHPVPRGTVKRLRVNQIISQTTRIAPARSKVLNEVVKKVLGTVPVNADGSCAFEAPAETALQFQMLDANGMAVMTMRSLVYLQAGERASCVGCHEPRSDTPPANARFVMPPVRHIEPTAGPQWAGGMSFVRDVQPVLDRYCIGCHGLGGKGMDLTGAKISHGQRSRFNAAYDSLLSARGMVALAPRNRESVYSVPNDYFAHAGKLAALLQAGHPDKQGNKRVQLDRDSFQRIVDWLDLNAQFYGDYSFNRDEDRQPLPAAEKALRAAIAKRFGNELAGQPFAALVNVANVDESRILLAPLPASAGGWGQVAKGAFKSKDDPAWLQLRKLVEASITPLKVHDIHGTCGRGSKHGCLCGNCWVRENIEARKKTAKVAGRVTAAAR